MQVVLYSTFTKAKNSTVQPAAGADSVTLTGILKDESSMIDPVIKIDVRQFTGDNKTIKRFNYARIPEYGRYYFVTRKVWVNGFWEFHMHTDVMGTWRTVIGSTYQYIARSAHLSDVDDSMIQPQLKPIYNKYAITDPFSDHPDISGGMAGVGNGSYVVVLAGAPSNAPTGSATVINNTYVLDRVQFDALRTELSTTAFTGIDPATDDITDNVAKVLINPFQYVIRSFYIPISKSDLMGNYTDSRIKYGWYSLNTMGAEVFSPLRLITLYNGAWPKHPSATDARHSGRMWRLSRWSKYYLQYPMIGTLEIPSDELIDTDRGYIHAILDVCSGEVFIQFGSYVYNPLQQTYVLDKTLVLARQNWSIDMPLSSYMRDPTSVQNSALGVVNTAQNIGKDLLTLDFAGALTDLTKGITSAKTAGARAMAAQVQNSGAPGNFSMLSVPPDGLITIWYYAENIDRHIGFLSMSTSRPSASSVNTYNNEPCIIVCNNPVLFDGGYTGDNALWLQDEYDEIIGYMRSGFYYV